MPFSRLLFLGAACLAGLPAARAQFQPPRMISDPGEDALQTVVGCDLSLNTYVLWTVGRGLDVNVLGVGGERRFLLSPGSQGCGDPGIVTSSVGTTSIVFTREDMLHPGREVHLASNPGGGFPPDPPDISRSMGDDYAPRIVLDREGQPHVTWAQRLGNGGRVMYRAPRQAPLAVASGDYPSIAIDAEGTVHLLYTRSRDLFLINNREGSFGRETAVTRTPLDQEYSFAIAASDPIVGVGNKLMVTYERKNSLYHQESTDGGNRFGPPRLVDSGGVSGPEMRVTGGLLTMVYEKHGDLYYVYGRVGSALPAPERITNTPEVEWRPSMTVDARGNLHLSYLKDGGVYYTNNSGVLAADFNASPTQGEAPLTARFFDLSRGGADSHEWDFGDGSPPSTEPNPVHIYQDPGKYSVKLLVRGVGSAESAMKKTEYIFVQSPRNKLWVENREVYPGTRDLVCPIFAQHPDDLMGFQIVGVFDPSVLHLKEVTRRQTSLENIEVELYDTGVHDDYSTPYFIVAAIFDYVPPWDDQTLPPSPGRRLTNLVFDVSYRAPPGETTLVELRNGISRLNLHNIFSIRQGGILPALRPGVITILQSDGVFTFKRGDADASGTLDVSDAVMVLNFLFQGGEEPVCLDAADFDDDGQVDITDSISLLNFLFLGGKPPEPPHPEEGPDPTEDSLKACPPGIPED